MNKELYNVCIMGVGFMLVFTAFQTIENIEKALLVSLHEDDHKFNGDAYISLAVVYMVFAFSNWLAPPFIALTGPRTAIVVGSLMYTVFMISLLCLTTWMLYVVSVFVGVGGAILWTGQGVFLTRCSNKETLSRNTGIFWVLYQCCLFFGNIFVFLELRHKKHIDRQSRIILISVLTAIVGLGNVVFLTLRYIPDTNETHRKPLSAAWLALQSSGRLFVTCDMLLLNVLFVYTGLLLTFITGIYGAAIGFTKKLAETPKEIMALAGLCMGVGEVFGGAFFGMLSIKTEHLLIDPLIISGSLCHMLAFILIWMNLPNKSPLGETDEISILDPPRLWLTLVCAVLLGLGDACFHVQIIVMLGGFYVQQTAEAFAIFIFTQSIAVAGAFLYSFYIGLMWQLFILLVCDTVGTFCFCLVKWRHKRKSRLKLNMVKNAEN